MLDKTATLLTAELLSTLGEMQSGDAIVLANDAFPAALIGAPVFHHPTESMLDFLRAILPRFPLQSTDEPALVMGAAAQDIRSPPLIWRSYQALIRKHAFDVTLLAVESDTFFHCCQSASLIISTRDTTPDSSILLRKGAGR